jgi:glycosyltransferase involved in cell wall biosynthesis
MYDTTAIVLTFNRARSLGRVLESLARQTLGGFHVLIADDASPDSTPALGAEWSQRDPRFVYRRRKQNVGMPANLNLALAEAKGEFLAILHDDDYYDHRLLEAWRAALIENPTAAFVFNAYRAIQPDGAPGTLFVEDLPCCVKGHDLLEKVFFRRWSFGSPVFGTVMLRREALEAVGALHDRLGFWADVDLWMRMAERFDVAYIREPLIGIADRALCPHQFADSFAVQQKIVERAFLEARTRHYRGRPLRLAAEVARHYSYAGAIRLWSLAGAARRVLRPGSGAAAELSGAVRSAAEPK